MDRAYITTKHRSGDKEDPSMFLLEKDLRVGKTKSLQFTKMTNPAVFAPRWVASSFPFSSAKLIEILNRFSFKTGSREADEIEKTLKQCEIEPAFENEHRHCMTSLESMVDFVKAERWKNVRAITTRVNGDPQPRHQNYTIKENVSILKGTGFAVCHKLNYPYAVYQCHAFNTSKAQVWRVPLKGPDATEAKALAVCHFYRYCWDPIFLKITNMLKPRPGVDHVCHFLGQDTIVWQAKDN